MSTDNPLKRKAQTQPKTLAKFPRLDEKNNKRKRDGDNEGPPTKVPRMMGSPLINKMKISNKAGTPGKTLTIKLKEKPTFPANYEEETWIKLKRAIQAVHRKEKVNSTLEELYRSVQDLVDNNMSENLYNKLQEEYEDHTMKLLKSILDEGRNTTLEKFLVVVNSFWSDYCDQMLLIRSIFLWLDRKYAIQRSDIKSLWEMALQLFSKNVLSSTDIIEKLRTGLLQVIESDRRGETIDIILVKSLMRMLSAVNMYSEYFEKYFLDATNIFYKKESDRYIQQFQVDEYLKHFEERIEQEGQRVLTYLSSSTRKPLIHTLETVAITNKIQPLLEKGYDLLFDGNKKDDLKRMFNLFQRVDGLTPLKDFWKDILKKRGEKIIMDEQNDKLMIETLLQFKKQVDGFLNDAYSNDPEFASASKSAFEYFINKRPNAPAELLAKFLDSKLRIGKDRRSMTDVEMELLLDRIMELFRYINGKDVFEAFYKKDLSKRLLLAKSASIDAEKAMISRLKTECGANFTGKLEGMFKDLDVSQNINNEFKESPEAKGYKGGVDVKVYVLTTGFWPTTNTTKCNLPPVLSDFQEIFQSFYLNKYSGRRLMWHHSLSQATLKAVFPKGRKELGTSLFQALVLAAFNDNPILTLKELFEITGIEKPELVRTIQSMSTPKVKLLVKDPPERQYNEADKVQINSAFNFKGVKININAIVQIKETKAEQKKTQETVFQDRVYQVDAAIVRVMKTRKTLSHNLLLTELYNQLKFPAKPADIKKRIESLIEREYLERDAQDANTYNYLA